MPDWLSHQHLANWWIVCFEWIHLPMHTPENLYSGERSRAMLPEQMCQVRDKRWVILLAIPHGSLSPNRILTPGAAVRSTLFAVCRFLGLPFSGNPKGWKSTSTTTNLNSPVPLPSSTSTVPPTASVVTGAFATNKVSHLFFSGLWPCSARHWSSPPDADPGAQPGQSISVVAYSPLLVTGREGFRTSQLYAIRSRSILQHWSITFDKTCSLFGA